MSLEANAKTHPAIRETSQTTTISRRAELEHQAVDEQQPLLIDVLIDVRVSEEVVRNTVRVNEAISERPRRRMVDWMSIAAMITALAAVVAVIHDEHAARVQQAHVALAKEDHIATGLNEAVDRLGKPGADYVHVRIGGIHELERLAMTAPQEQAKIVEKLVAFVREYAARQGGRCSGQPVGQDVQAALTALGRRDPDADGDTEIDLSHTCLTAANLEEADFSGAVFVGTDLRAARLEGARFTNAVLNEATLVDAHMVLVDLQGAEVYKADLTGVNFHGADLRNVQLMDSTLVNALLSNTDLRLARLYNVNARNASITFADGESATLMSTDFTGASFLGSSFRYADFSEAILYDTVLDGADFTYAHHDDATVVAQVHSLDAVQGAWW